MRSRNVLKFLDKYFYHLQFGCFFLKKGIFVIFLLGVFSFKEVSFLKEKKDVGWSLQKTLLSFKPYKENFDFTIGFTTGAIKGGIHCLKEFFPYLISMVSGIKHGIFAFVDSPSHFTKEVIKYSQILISFIKEHTAYEMVSLIIPEIKVLIEHWNEHTSYQKGNILGYILGNYGLDFFGFYGSIKGVQFCKTMKKANMIYSLKKLTTTASQLKAISYSSYLWQKRMRTLYPKTVPVTFFSRGKFIKTSVPMSAIHGNEILMDRSLWMGDFIAYMEDLQYGE